MPRKSAVLLHAQATKQPIFGDFGMCDFYVAHGGCLTSSVAAESLFYMVLRISSIFVFYSAKLRRTAIGQVSLR